jgi:glutamate synthase (ferredoxin)
MSLLEWVAVVTLSITGFLIVVVVSSIVALFIAIRKDKKQAQHAILRNFPLLGRIRYFSEAVSPEIHQYFTEGEQEGTPFTKLDIMYIVKAAKYISTVISFGTKRMTQLAGYYIRNAFLPKQLTELRVDNSDLVPTKKYQIEKETLFKRVESQVDAEVKPWLLHDDDAIIIGKNTVSQPFVTKSMFGMSGMSYGALGEHAIQALSQGLGLARAWMNTGEGGLSEHHLSGGVDIIAQIGPGKFGYRNPDGSFSYEELKKKALMPQVKMFEIKIGQGAKIRGGHLEGAKVTPEIAKIRGVEPWKTINSPNRFDEFSNEEGLLNFLVSIRDVADKPVGIKVVIGDTDSLDELCRVMIKTNQYPDFITVDGGEGGTGATYKSMADSVGLPSEAAIMIADETLNRFGIRDRMKIIASGKKFSADRIAIALAMGADLINIARGYMLSVGCISSQVCSSGHCPVGVATTNPKLQEALVVDEKKYRVLNYTVTLREELFTLAAAAGLKSPTEFNEKHIVYKTEEGIVKHLLDIKKENGVLTQK